MNATARRQVGSGAAELGKPGFPFSALVAQKALQQALLLVVIDSRIGGVLIDGPRGTAKSTSARAVAELLHGGSFVTLPLGATEEMLIGTLDVEAALRGGEVRFAPGLLARAHGGVLYVDEVNLLPDVLVDQLLDVAASGVNVIEREGISHQHPASFALIGTMNPEEGELRPQLLDRFGLALTLENCLDPVVRREIVKAQLAFDADPVAFRARFAQRQDELRTRLIRARAALPHLPISDAIHDRVSALCIDAQVDGLRADLVMTRAARAMAAWQGDDVVTTGHVEAVAELALQHRRRTSGAGPERLKGRSHGEANAPAAGPTPVRGEPLAPAAGSLPVPGEARAPVGGPAPVGGQTSAVREPRSIDRPPIASNGHAGSDSTSCPAEPTPQSWGELPPQPLGVMPAHGIKLSAPRHDTNSGRGMLDTRTGNRWNGQQAAMTQGIQHSRRIHWPRTLVAKQDGALRREHLLFWPASAGAGTLHCFLVDCSGSMLAGRQLALAKGLLMQLIHSAYQQRAEVAIVGFAGSGAKVHLPPTLARPLTSKHVEAWLQPIRACGGTPFGRGAAAAAQVLAGAARMRPAQSRWLWLLTDGRSPESPSRPPAADVAVVIDCERQRVRLNRCRALAERWRAHYQELADFRVGSFSENHS